MEINKNAFSWESARDEGFFKSIFELDAGVTSTWMVRNFSTAELIEKVLFELAFETDIFLASLEGKLMKIDAPFFISQDCFDHIHKYAPAFFSEGHFSSTHIDPKRKARIDEILSEGKDPWWELRNARGFCSMNYYYDRDVYCISLNVLDTIRAVDNYYWPNLPDVPEAIIRSLTSSRPRNPPENVAAKTRRTGQERTKTMTRFVEENERIKHEYAAYLRHAKG